MLSRIQSRKVSSRAFFEAVEQNNTSGLIDLVLSTNCDPRYIRNEQQQSLLHIACQLNCNGAIDMVRVLVEIYQCSPLLTDQNSLTCYEYACFSGNVEVLAYLFRKSDHHFIINYQPPPQSFQMFSHAHSDMLITAAGLSGSIEMLRFVYSIFHHTSESEHDHNVFNLKYSLYKDKLAIVCKAVSCKNGMKHTIHSWCDIEVCLYEACCGGILDSLTFFLDELTIEKHLYSDPVLKSKGQVKQVYASLLETACRLNKYEIVHYLTTSKGIGPVQTPSRIRYNDTGVYTADTLHNRSVLHEIDTCSPLNMAVRSGNIEIVKGFTVYQHHLYRDADTLLHSACVSGKKEMVKLVIDKFGCSTNACNIDEDTPLHVACEWGHLDICLLLLEQEGCDINATNIRGHTPLSLAIRHRRFEIFQILLNKGANIYTKTKDTYETPLHFACSCLDSQFALALLENRVCSPKYLNDPDKYGDAALFNACRIRNVTLVKALITKSECVRSFINGTTDEMAAHIASRMNSLDILKVLVSEGLDSPMQCYQLNYLEQSLLHLACDNDAEDIIDYLIDNKICELNNFDYYGQKPLHIACMRGNTRIVKKLLTSEKFKVTDKDKEDNTVLHYICNRGVVDPGLIKSCLNSENRLMSMITEQNSSKYNPLHYVCADDGTQILHCLLMLSENHESFNNALCVPSGDAGDTPLHLAFINRSSTIIKFMINSIELSKGLSKAICVQNSDKKNIFHCTFNQNHTVRDANGRKISNSFAVTMIDLLLLLQEEVVVKSLCQKNNEENTPIQYLINEVQYYGEHSETSIILSHLLHSKLSPKSKQRIFSETTSDGNTLIHLAAKRGYFDVVKLLVNQKVCTFAIYNKKDESPLHIACRVNNESEMSFWLCEHGYDPYQLNKSGHSPLFNSIESHQTLPEQLFKTIHWKPEAPILRVLVNSDSAKYKEYYERIMIDTKSLTHFQVEVPLPHCMLLYHGHNIRSNVIDIVIEFPDLQDSLGNTILHLCSVLFHNKNIFLKTLLACENYDVNLRNKEGNTPLHVACAANNRSMVALLLENDKCSESLNSRNVNGHTPLYYTADRDLINCLILNGADPNDIADSARVKHINEAFDKVKKEHPLDPTVTALILGNSLAGKTTLIKTLRRAYNEEQIDKPSIGQSDSILREERTTGVEIIEYKVFNEPNDPRILFYDFAGHTQSFQSTHSILLQTLLSKSHLSPILFIIVVDISDKIPVNDRLSQLRYWAKFIDSCQPLIMPGVIEVIIIGSHIDEVSDKGKQASIKESLSKAMQPFESDTFKLIENPFLLDCRESSASELLRVRGILLRSVNQLKEHAELDNRCHLVFSYLYEHFPDKPVRFTELHRSFRKRKPTQLSTNESEIPLMANKLISLLKNMQSRQHIMLIGLTESTKSDFWVLTAKAQNSMFHHVHGLLFAEEEDFKDHIEIESNTGLLSSTELKKAFPDLDYEMLQEFLEYSELCKKIGDERVLQLIQYGTTKSEESIEFSLGDDIGVYNEQSMSDLKSDDLQMSDKVEYFFFPRLVKETRKHVLQDKQYSYSSGWSLECIKDDSFKAIFLQVLILRLIFRFATSSESDNKLHRCCHVWTSGVAWSKAGVEVCVEMTDPNQKIIVIVRCLKGAELTAVELRSAIIQEVYSVKAKYGARTKINEFIVCNPRLNEDGLLVEPIQKIAIKTLASAITSGSCYVTDNSHCHEYHINEDLLYFELYSGVDSDLMAALFDSSKKNELVPEKTTHNIETSLKKAAVQSKHIERFMQLLIESKPILYHNLRDQIDKYSVFRGRNPKGLC